MRRHDDADHQLDLAVCNTRAAVGHVRDRVQAEALVIAVRALPEAVREPAGQLKGAPDRRSRPARLPAARRGAPRRSSKSGALSSPTSMLVGRLGVLTCRSEPRLCAPGRGGVRSLGAGPGPAGASSRTAGDPDQ